jgi:hypothetical protein
VIAESALQNEKHFDPTISILFGISISDDPQRLRINLCRKTSIKSPLSTTRISLPDSIEIEDRITWRNAEPSMN